MDYSPREIIRMIQVGLDDEVLDSKAIWLCASCFSCTVRCPQEIDITGIMHKLRNFALTEGRKTANTLFDKISMDAIEKYGIFPECLAAMKYTVKAKSFKKLPLGLRLFKCGKLKILPEGIKNPEEIKEIFEKL
jgi:heterodisulfide reductase subunit C